jgi:DNA helicase-2/ATP-dependent DNA helicase PcrA
MDIVKFFGPPGTGKTTTLLNVMAEELKRTDPDRIAFLTFTVHARKVAIEKALERFPNLTKDDLKYFKTLHAICYHELNMTMGGMVKGPNDMKELAEKLGLLFTYKVKHGGAEAMMEIPYGGEMGDRLLQIDHVRRHRMQALDDGWRCQFDDDLNMFQVRRFVSEYGAWKHREGLRDFTDLLEQATEPLDVDVVIVDEAQDLSVLQWTTLHRLTRNAARMYIAGDDDQAIFTWAGADPLALINHPGRAVVLDQSYRVPMAIQPIATRLVERIKVRQPKVWKPRPSQGRLRYAGETQLPSFDEEGSYMILYRQHYLVKEMEKHVRSLGVSYSRGDIPAPGAEWGKSIITWESLRKGKTEPERAVHFMLDALALDDSQRKRLGRLDRNRSYGLADLGLDDDRPWFEAFEKVSLDDRQYLRSLIRRHGAKGITDKPKVHLSTIHAAKGAERDHVVMLTETSDRVRDIMMTDPDDERRVFYVGVTRARESLTLIGLDNPLL